MTWSSMSPSTIHEYHHYTSTSTTIIDYYHLLSNGRSSLLAMWGPQPSEKVTTFGSQVSRSRWRPGHRRCQEMSRCWDGKLWVRDGKASECFRVQDSFFFFRKSSSRLSDYQNISEYHVLFKATWMSQWYMWYDGFAGYKDDARLGYGTFSGWASQVIIFVDIFGYLSYPY